MPKTINVNENKIIKMYCEEFLTQREIAKYLGCSMWKVQQVLKQHDIPINRKKLFRQSTQEDIDDIIKYYVIHHKTTEQISNIYGCTGDHIRKILNKHGVNTPRSLCAIGKNNIRKERQRKNGDNEFSNAYRNIMLSVFGAKCFNCKSNTDMTIDHNYPLSKGYGLSIINAVPLCRSCNSSKGTKDPIEYYNSEKFLNLCEMLYSAENALHMLQLPLMKPGIVYKWDNKLQPISV